ncbi:MAG: hypothetical protein IKT41_03435 [Clostridia bacterium]|nr:hypothetical protein [Clostridia bacterium]
MKKQNKRITKKKKNKEKNIKPILIFFMLIVILYSLYSIINLVIKPVDVVLVEEGKIYSEETTVGYILREEVIVSGENYKNGLIQIKTEGEKVAKGDSVFRYYSNNEEQLKKQIDELNNKLQEAIEQEEINPNSDIKILESQIEEKIENIQKENDLKIISENKKEIETAITKKAEIAGELSPAGSYIKNLISEKAELENKKNSGAEYVNATNSGVVSYRVDGLEGSLKVDDFSNLNWDTLEKLNLKTGQIIASSNEQGKIVNNFKCDIVILVDKEKTENIKLGKTIKLRLSNGKEITSKVVYMVDEDDKNSLIVLEINNEIEYLINYRKITIDIIWWNESGWKIPDSAITEENGINYVIRDKAGYIDKIPIKILKDNGIYSIVDNYTAKELKELGYDEEKLKTKKSISLYDEIRLNE